MVLKIWDIKIPSVYLRNCKTKQKSVLGIKCVTCFSTSTVFETFFTPLHFTSEMLKYKVYKYYIAGILDSHIYYWHAHAICVWNCFTLQCSFNTNMVNFRPTTHNGKQNISCPLLSPQETFIFLSIFYKAQFKSTHSSSSLCPENFHISLPEQTRWKNHVFSESYCSLKALFRQYEMWHFSINTEF
jgi:hypothetical protein